MTDTRTRILEAAVACIERWGLANEALDTDAVLSRGARYPGAVRGWEAELVTCTDISNWPVALTRDSTGLWYYCVISDQN